MVSPAEAVKLVKSGERIWLHPVAATPHMLIDALMDRYKELKNVELISIHTEGRAKWTEAPYDQAFFGNNAFCGANVRKAVQENRAGYIPVFLSEVPLLFTRKVQPLDVAFVQVSPPDKHGFCSLGTSVEVTITALECAKKVIAQINPTMPRTHGDGIVHVSKFDATVWCNEPIIERVPEEPSPEEVKIGENIAALVENGATLQMGIGTIANAALAAMKNHKELGVHTEMLSDGIIDLIDCGAVTGEHKVIGRDQVVTSFCMGSRRLYDYINDNPFIKFNRVTEVNSPIQIMRNPKVTAINSCIEIDLTGQVVSDSIGGMIYSGVGGQMDFIRGAALSEGGKPIIALPSVTSKGVSKIVPFLNPGAGVVTTRAHVHWVVTEFGAVNLFGLNLRDRAKALINIAHPSHREALDRAVKTQYWRGADKAKKA